MYIKKYNKKVKRIIAASKDQIELKILEVI